MTKEQIVIANRLTVDIDTLNNEISTMSSMIYRSHRINLKRLLKRPTEKTAFNYWSSQDVDSINSIILIEPDEIQVLIDYKKAKVERLQKELGNL